jgi:hypothetical protein
MALTVAQIIEVGHASKYLAQIDVLKAPINGAKLDPRLPITLAMETDSVEWIYDLDNDDSTLTDTSNYLLSLCGAYARRALAIIGSGGGSITPVAPAGYAYTSLGFTVTATDTGDGSPVNDENDWYNAMFVGAQQLTYILVNNMTETVVGGEFTFVPATGIITRTNTFVTGDKIVVSFLRRL